jgi:preprotein translocase subunit SecY
MTSREYAHGRFRCRHPSAKWTANSIDTILRASRWQSLPGDHRAVASGCRAAKVATIPFVGDWLDANLPKVITEGMNVQFFVGGTSLLIVVGVAMDTVQQVESQLIMRHYDGFMKKSRIRGRRA